MANTRHVNKNGLSFECPDYYETGKYPSSDESYKSIVALSKKDRECEIYVLVYKKSTFDNNAINNVELIKKYLQLKNYTNITVNKNLPYCFNANTNFNGINVKSTLAYDFNHNNVILVVGNVRSFSNYDCTKDLQIILNSVKYKSNNALIIIGIISFIISLIFFWPLIIVTIIAVIYLLVKR